MKRKNLVAWIVIVVVIGAAVFLYKTKGDKEVPPAPVVSVPLADAREYCFVYKHEATKDAPYSVEEHLKLSRVRGDITGTKTGTQAGPDMTNGYTGTLIGKAVADAKLEMVYSYTVEGSSAKELEIYRMTNETIVKDRYPLIEGKYNGVSMLIPDKTKEFTELTYVPETCAK